jgi:hypothetical protein
MTKHKKNNRKKSTPKTNIMKGVGGYSRVKGRGKYSGVPTRLRGRGGYAEDIGGQIGSWLGKKAGGLFSSITGLGEYTVKHNTLVKPNDPPIISNTTSATRIQHREYIQDISGSTAFTIQSFAVNPGIAGTFPWLSTVANAFEQYRMHGLLFEFKSTSADALNSTNTALGTVIQATEYNPLHPPFVAKRDMENYVYSTSGPPSCSALHPIECARDVSVMDEFFVRNVPVPDSDLRFSDMGNYQIATIGMQAAAVIGELWVTYDIELIKPKLPDAFSSVGPAHYGYSRTGPIVPSPWVAEPTSADLFGSSGAQKFGLLGTGISPVTLNTNTIIFKNTGRYICLLNQASTVTWASASNFVTNGASVTGSGLIHAPGLVHTLIIPENTQTSLTKAVLFAVNVNDLIDPTVEIGLTTVPTTNPTYDLWIFPLPQGFSTRPITVIQALEDQVTELRKLMELNNLKLREIQSDFEPFDSDKKEETLSRSVVDFASKFKNLLDQKAQ